MSDEIKNNYLNVDSFFDVKNVASFVASGETSYINNGLHEVMQILRPGCVWEIDSNTGSREWVKYWHPEGLPRPSFEEIDKETEYQTKVKNYYQYAYDRCLNYPDAFQQLEMLWDAVDKGVDLKESLWYKSIKDVKEKYPKPKDVPPTRE